MLNLSAIIKKSFFCLANNARKNENRIVGKVFGILIMTVSRIIKDRRFSYYMRNLLTLVYPSDPLKFSNLPMIDVVIPCSIQDMNLLHLTIKGVRYSVRNPIGKIYIISPEKFCYGLKNQFPDCQVLSDSEILPYQLVSLIEELVPEKRRGWVKQQCIKFLMVNRSEQIASLVVDADTVLIKPRVWISSQLIQTLSISTDFHAPYKNHQKKFLTNRNLFFGFVTNYQLMQKSLVKQIFGVDLKLLSNWIKMADFKEHSPLSEYDTYGEFLVRQKPKSFVFAKWNNIESRINPYTDGDFEEILKQYNKYCSISSHWHL